MSALDRMADEMLSALTFGRDVRFEYIGDRQAFERITGACDGAHGCAHARRRG